MLHPGRSIDDQPGKVDAGGSEYWFRNGCTTRRRESHHLIDDSIANPVSGAAFFRFGLGTSVGLLGA